MRVRRYWPPSITGGAAVVVLAWAFADLCFGAVAFGVCYAAVLGLLCEAHFGLRSRVDPWKRPS